MKKIVLIFILALSLGSFKMVAQDLLVTNITEYNTAIKTAKAGDVIVLKNGIWKDVKLNAFGKGEKGKPIVVKAETSGQVIISGNSTLNIYGEYVIVSGFWFKDGDSSYKSVVQFRKDSKTFANHCRLTNSTISYYKVSEGIKDHWVDIWGKNNRVDHCNFTGKTSPGTTLVVWLKGEEHIENNHRIDHNIFGARPELGVNGGETIRIGTSANSMKSSRTLVESNTFRNCDGEIEIISNKSNNNIFRNNLFIESKGALTLRHGDNALVEGNVFLGNNVSKTGGVRIINSGHIVRNNLFIGLKGTGYRGPIVVMNGVPNSPLNRYNQVKNVNIQNNTIINCGTITLGAGKDDEKTLAPINTVFANNLISNLNGKTIFEAEDDISGISFKNNIVDSSVAIQEGLFTKATIDWSLLRSLPMPSSKNLNLVSNYKDDKSPKLDMVNSERNQFVVGAFNLDNKRIPKAILSRNGPSWKPDIIAPKKSTIEKIINVEPGIGTLAKAIKSADNYTTLHLKEGVYFVNKTQKVKGKLSIIGNGKSVLKAEDKLPKALNYFFRVTEEATLSLKGLVIDGDNDTKVKYAIVSPDENENNLYNLFIDNCTFQNFNNKRGGSIFKAYVGTLADTISIKNATFKDSYRGLNLSYEKNGFGKYNANVILVHNSIFDNIEEHAINYTKTGPLMNTGKGKLIVTNSIFNGVANSEKGTIISSKNIPSVSIKHSVFQNSYKIVTAFSLNGIGSSIENCLLNVCGKIKVSKGASAKDILYKNPKWENKKTFIPSKKSSLLKENNNNQRIGLLNN